MRSSDQDSADLQRAAEWIHEADGLLITAGAGMGVDSGLPDFRGAEGFWRAYPALARARLRFESIASPHTFASDPALAWGFYGHRLKLYRRTVPHEGFGILDRWADRKPLGTFVFTQ
jgi:NAD-dependent SIR2 family protein deacetylase